MIMNGVGAIGRIFPGLIADQWCGPLQVVIPASSVCMVMLYSWNTIETRVALYVFAVIYGMLQTHWFAPEYGLLNVIFCIGIFGATVQGIFPAALSSMTTDLSKAGIRMGMVFSIVGFANLTGPPLAGALIQKAGGEYKYAFVFAGTCLCLGTTFSVACRIAKGGLTLKVKV
jgi:MFS family permease